LNITQNNVHTFTLNWSDHNIGEEGFKVERSIDGGVYSEIASVPDTAFVDDTVFKGYATVNYQVRAYKDSIYTDYISDSSSVSFPAPTDLSFTKISLSNIQLDWSEAIDGEDGFKIDKKIGDSEWFQSYGSVGENITAWTDTNAEINENIVYRVYSYKGLNFSESISTELIDNNIPPPTDLKTSIASETSIKLDWFDNSTGEDGFKIDRKIGLEGDFVNLATVLANTVTWTDTNLLSGTKYFYKVYTFKSSYFSDFSNIATITTIDLSKFVYIPLGSFDMGQDGVAIPVHRVNLTREFYLGKYEVTQKEWFDIIGSYPPLDYGLGDTHPIYYMNWYSLLVYCNKRSIDENLEPCYKINNLTNPEEWGYIPQSDNPVWNSAECNFNLNGYRLPSEAEWEYAARYNDGRTYPWGALTPADSLCNNNNQFTSTVEVGSYPAGISQLGLCDVAGNVWEWLWDWYDLYQVNEQTDPTGPITATTTRILRGGGWGVDNNSIKCAYRENRAPHLPSGSVGFRLARTK
jgi:formylglycine-generating enzyme required for sulfatase activity